MIRALFFMAGISVGMMITSAAVILKARDNIALIDSVTSHTIVSTLKPSCYKGEYVTLTGRKTKSTSSK